jgi:hypothetical protein
MRLIRLAVVLAVSLKVASLAAEIQPEEKIFRVGHLSVVVDPDHQSRGHRPMSRTALSDSAV